LELVDEDQPEPVTEFSHQSSTTIRVGDEISGVGQHRVKGAMTPPTSSFQHGRHGSLNQVDHHVDE